MKLLAGNLLTVVDLDVVQFMLGVSLAAWVFILGSGYVNRVVDLPLSLKNISLGMGPPFDASGFLGAWFLNIRGAVVAAAVMLLAFGWGLRLVRMARIRGTGRGFLAVGLGFAVQGAALLGLGLAGLLHPVLIAGLLFAAGVPAWPRIREAAGNARRLLGRGWLELLVGLSTALVCVWYLTAALAPELGWDALTYHLRVPSHYLAAGRIYIVPFSLGSFYPFLAEMWSMAAKAFGGDSAAKLLNHAFLLMTCLLLTRMGEEGGSRLAGLCGALLFAAMPAAGVLSSQCYNDMEVAFLSLLAVRASMRLGTARRLAAGALCGAAIGCKYTGAYILPMCGVLWAWQEWKGRRSVLAVVFPAIVALAVFAIWPLRDWLWTGNPVFPLAPRLFPMTGWNPYFTAQQAESIVPVQPPSDFLAAGLALVRFPFEWPWNIFAIGVSFSPLITGFLPGLLLPDPARPEAKLPERLPLREPREAKLPERTVFRPPEPQEAKLPGGRVLAARVPALFGIAYVALWILAQASDGRYLLTAAALLALPAGIAAVRFASISFLASLGTGFAFAWIVGGQLLHWTAYEAQAYAPFRVSMGLETRDTYRARAMLPNFEYMPLANLVNTTLPKRARILLYSDIVTYYIEREVVFDTQQVMPPIGVRLTSACTDPRALRKKLAQLGIGYMIHSPIRIIALQRSCKCVNFPEGARECYRTFMRRYADRVIDSGNFLVYRLRSERAAAKGPLLPLTSWPGVQEKWTDMAEDGRAAGDWRKVGEALAPLKKLAPELADVRLRLAEMLLVNGKVAEAKRELEAGRKLGADSGLYWLISAGMRATLKDYEGGAEAAREAAKRWPVPRVYAALAANEMNVGKRPEAEAAIRKAYILNPYDAEVRRILKQIFPAGLP